MILSQGGGGSFMLIVPLTLSLLLVISLNSSLIFSMAFSFDLAWAALVALAPNLETKRASCSFFFEDFLFCFGHDFLFLPFALRIGHSFFIAAHTTLV